MGDSDWHETRSDCRVLIRNSLKWPSRAETTTSYLHITSTKSQVGNHDASATNTYRFAHWAVAVRWTALIWRQSQGSVSSTYIGLGTRIVACSGSFGRFRIRPVVERRHFLHDAAHGRRKEVRGGGLNRVCSWRAFGFLQQKQKAVMREKDLRKAGTGVRAKMEREFRSTELLCQILFISSTGQNDYSTGRLMPNEQRQNKPIQRQGLFPPEFPILNHNTFLRHSAALTFLQDCGKLFYSYEKKVSVFSDWKTSWTVPQRRFTASKLCVVTKKWGPPTEQAEAWLFVMLQKHSIKKWFVCPLFQLRWYVYAKFRKMCLFQQKNIMFRDISDQLTTAILKTGKNARFMPGGDEEAKIQPCVATNVQHPKPCRTKLQQKITKKTLWQAHSLSSHSSTRHSPLSETLTLRSVIHTPITKYTRISKRC